MTTPREEQPDYIAREAIDRAKDAPTAADAAANAAIGQTVALLAIFEIFVDIRDELRKP